MPAGRVFIDSNTFLYPADQFEPEKGRKSSVWITALAHAQAGITNLQVLNEFTNVILRKSAGFGGIDPFPLVDDLASYGDTSLTPQICLVGRLLRRRYGYSWWDCLLLVSALELGCTHFLSEDLQDGQSIEGNGRALTIVDPFAHSPEQILQ